MIPILRAKLRLAILCFTMLALPSMVLAGKPRFVKPTTYPLGDDRVRLGGVEEYAMEWKWVEAPRRAVEAAKGILEGPPAEWDVSLFFDDPTPGKQVVFLDDGKYNCFVCLVKRDRWIRLNEKAGIPAINEATKDMPGRDIFAANIHDRIIYVQEVVNFYRGSLRALLHDDFLYDMGVAKSEGGKQWVTDKEPNPEVFSKLCHDPVMTRNGGHVSIRFNVLVSNGAAEEWTLKGTWNQGLVVQDIDVKALREPGTFRWDYN